MHPKTVELLRVYQDYEERIRVDSRRLRGSRSDPKLASLITFSGNLSAPVHNWFKFKEGFSGELLAALLKELDVPKYTQLCLLDPFAGVGTSALSAQMLRSSGWLLDAFGVEVNPFIHFVAKAKLAWPQYDPGRIQALQEKILRLPFRPEDFDGDLPELSTLRNPRVFPEERMRQLLAARERIREETDDLVERDFFLLGFASILEGLSGTRKTGRALKFIERHAVPSVSDALREQWCKMSNDLQKLAEQADTLNPARVERGSALALSSLSPRGSLREGTLDLTLYSPPYLNNIDYTEVYKIELWMLEYVSTSVAFRAQRLQTLRSHPSIKFPCTDRLDRAPGSKQARRLRTALIEALPQREGWRAELVSGYMDDMHLCLRNQFRLARKRGFVICVVGNSLHLRGSHNIPVATDLLIASLAQGVGFEIEKLIVARQLRWKVEQPLRRYLRDSIIVMRKP